MEDRGFLMIFGENLRKHRLKKGLSYRKLAQRCNVEYTHIRKIERGLVSIQLLTILELAKGLNIHPKELFDFKFDKKLIG